MADNLFFGEIEKANATASAAYMATRGAHVDQSTVKKICVEGNPGTNQNPNSEDSKGE